FRVFVRSHGSSASLVVPDVSRRTAFETRLEVDRSIARNDIPTRIRQSLPQSLPMWTYRISRTDSVSPPALLAVHRHLRVSIGRRRIAAHLGRSRSSWQERVGLVAPVPKLAGNHGASRRPGRPVRGSPSTAHGRGTPRHGPGSAPSPVARGPTQAGFPRRTPPETSFMESTWNPCAPTRPPPRRPTWRTS